VTVTVKVTSLRDVQGTVRACLTDDSKTFPNCPKGAHTQSADVPASAETRLVFTGVKPGDYAISLLHDENNNGKMDKKMLFMPKEGYGFSRDAPVKMAPPSFDSAKFTVGSEPVNLTIKVRYM
jgi:uncharacterized protein (DUF2141 family)